MVTFADPVDGVPFTDPDGLDDRTLWLRAYNGVGELVAATEPVWLVDARRGPVDDMTTPAATADLSAAGTLTNTDAVGTLPPSDLLQVGAWAKWDRVLTAAELAVLPARLDA